jgi:tripartite ATP-independent transporter DctM subunit
VLYAVIVECFIHRDLRTTSDLPRIAVESGTLVGGFLIILGVALGFTNYLVQAEVPTQLLGWVQSHISSPIVFLLVLNAFLIIVGAAMDIYSAILVVVPLILPLGAAYGISPVHLGIVFLANMELGYLTPPMGENLFLSSFRFKQPLTRICLAAVPYWIILLVAVLVITYAPVALK